jgi:putative mycofactocin binding protein MftB
VPATSTSLDSAWRLHAQVALRPEPFGALAYHFGTRRLSFLKTPKLVAVVQALGDHGTARAACVRAGVTEDELADYAAALERLAASGMIVSRQAA